MNEEVPFGFSVEVEAAKGDATAVRRQLKHKDKLLPTAHEGVYTLYDGWQCVPRRSQPCAARRSTARRRRRVHFNAAPLASPLECLTVACDRIRPARLAGRA